MELVFPFKNLTINNLLDFYGKEKVKDFSDLKFGKSFFQDDYFYDGVRTWKDELPSLENEILQIINTSDQKTIDTYFSNLAESLKYIKSRSDRQYFVERIASWNDEILKKYSETVEKEGAEYAMHEDRKRNHLEVYEDFYHSPFFGSKPPFHKLEKTNYNFYCVEKTPDLIEIEVVDDYLPIVVDMLEHLITISAKYGIPWQEGKLKSRVEERFIPKPIIFVEGDHDIAYIKAAAVHLKKEKLLQQIELRQRGGYKNLDKLWNILKEESWETIPQIKIFLYDCDTNKTPSDFGLHFQRVIPTFSDNIIKRGIENLIPDSLVKDAIKEKKEFVDYKRILGIRRGIEYEEIQHEINKDEKTNFCHWIISNGKQEDFVNFKCIFDLIEDVFSIAKISHG